MSSVMNIMQLRNPSHPSRGIPTAVNCFATLLKEPLVRSSFVQADGVKLLIPFINPVSNQSTPIASSQSNQQSMQVKFACFVKLPFLSVHRILLLQTLLQMVILVLM